MGLSAWNAYRARIAEEEKALGLVSTSPVVDGEVETVKEEPEQVVEPEIEEPKPKKKRTK
jgi:hypothetical protein